MLVPKYHIDRCCESLCLSDLELKLLSQQSGRAMLGLPSGLEPMAVAPTEPSHAIQEQNLKAALEASSIFAETLDSDGTAAIEEIEREV